MLLGIPNKTDNNGDKIANYRGIGLSEMIESINNKRLSRCNLDLSLQESFDQIHKIVTEVDLVLSDMASDTTGHKSTDHIRTQELAELAADYALNFLKTGGSFCSKVFQGGTHQALLDILKKNFTTIKHYKPDASRKGSPENYVIAKGFKG